MRELAEEEKSQLRAKIMEGRDQQRQVVRETMRQNDAFQAMRAVGEAGPIDWSDLFWFLAFVFIFGNAVLNGLFPELNLLWCGGFLILVAGALARVIVVDIVKSLRNRECELTRSDTKSLRGQIGWMLLCVGLGVVGVFMILAYFSDLDDAWEGIVVDKRTYRTGGQDSQDFLSCGS